jgi:dephospho-CoA kinase
MMKVLGLTGGIGSGKSTIAKIFRTLGVPVYNSDDRGREMYFEAEVRNKVEALLGKKAYRGERELDREFVRSKIFSDESMLAKINGIIHPAVKKDFELFKKRHKKAPYVVKETALLFEAGIDKSVDKILLVVTDPALRMARLKKRDAHLSEAEIDAVIAKQWADKDKSKKADWVIENNEEKLVIPQILKVHEALLH